MTLSPAAFPTGTRPPAIAPTTVPMKKGVRIELTPKSSWAASRPRARRAVWWNAKPEPRSTIPSAARLSGMNSVEKIASNAGEKPVQRTTRTKISQTWLASQTGPIAESISSRGRRPLAAAGQQAPEPRAEVGAAEDGVHRQPDEEDDGDGVGLAHRRRSSAADAGRLGPYGTSDSALFARRASVATSPAA